MLNPPYTSPSARLLGQREQRFAADRLGRQPGQLHAELGLGDPVERAAQPRLAPPRQLAAPAVLLPEEDPRARPPRPPPPPDARAAARARHSAPPQHPRP